MAYGSDNIYSQPEEYGLKILGSVERGEGYDFDLTMVFKDVKTKALYFASDAGCSCYPPFDGMGREVLTPLDNPRVLRDHLHGRGRRDPNTISQEITLTQRVKEQFKRARRKAALAALPQEVEAAIASCIDSITKIENEPVDCCDSYDRS